MILVPNATLNPVQNFVDQPSHAIDASRDVEAIVVLDVEAAVLKPVARATRDVK